MNGNPQTEKVSKKSERMKLKMAGLKKKKSKISNVRELK